MFTNDLITLYCMLVLPFGVESTGEYPNESKIPALTGKLRQHLYSDLFPNQANQKPSRQRHNNFEVEVNLNHFLFIQFFDIISTMKIFAFHFVTGDQGKNLSTILLIIKHIYSGTDLYSLHEIYLFSIITRMWKDPFQTLSI